MSAFEVKYIYHSCFYVETLTKQLVFDYYKGALPPLCENKPLYFFASHVHADHFSTQIFSLPVSSKTAFILSNDIKRKFNTRFLLSHGANEDQLSHTSFVSANASLDIDGMKVSTLRSTDSGVAFIVETDGLRFYHAGDLNLWLWDCDTAAEQNAMRATFNKEIEHIALTHFDAAFLPLDPRLEENFCTGFDTFMRKTDTMTVYPMHCWDDYTVIDKLIKLPCSAPYRERIVHTK